MSHIDTRIDGRGYEILRRVSRDRKPIRLHVLIAERAMGKPLPPGAVVHHVDGNRANNEGRNLVVCPDQKYHILLHRRQRAKDACGDASWRLCSLCGEYDAPANLVIYKTNSIVRHAACASKYRREYYQRKKALDKPLD